MSTAITKQTVNSISNILLEINIKRPLYNTLISIAQFKALKRIEKIKKMKPYNIENPQKIIFHCVHCNYLSSIYKEAAIAKALQLLGHNIEMLICGNILDCCTGMFNIDVPQNKGMCKNCLHHGNQLFNILDLPYKTYYDYLEDDDESAIDVGLEKGKIFGVDVKYHGLSSALRYAKGGKTNSKIYNSKLMDAVIATMVAKNLNKTNPDKIVTSHSCYAEWGSFSDYFRLQNVPVYTWYTGYNIKSLVFDLLTIDRNFQEYRKRRNHDWLYTSEKTKLLSYLAKRRTGTDDTNFYNFISNSKEAIELKSNIQEGKKIYTMYPNLAWDVDPTCAGDFFSDTFDWVDKTINIFTELPDKHLIIRAHPAEQVYKSKITTVEHINDTFPELPKNITVIDSKSSLNSYELFSYTNIGIVSNGTIGLEMSVSNIPTIVVGNAHYKNKGFTYDVNTLNEYENMIKANLIGVPNKEIRDLYCYYYFIKSFIPFPILRHRNFLDIGWNIKKQEDLLTDKYLFHIANYILGDRLFQEW